MNKKRIIDLILSTTSLAGIVFLYRYDLNFHREWVMELPQWAASFFVMIYLPKIFRAIFILLLMWFSLRLIFYCLLKPSFLKPIYKRILLVFTSLYLLLLLLEGIFGFVAISNQNWNALAQQNWMLYYTNELNQFGFRDREVKEEDLKKKKILVSGDSFSRGDGIKDISDTYAGQLQKLLPPGWRVFNVSKSGVGLRGKFYHITQFPLKPDLIILQYFPNDPMEDYQQDKLHSHDFKTVKQATLIGELLSKHSYFINFINYYIRPGLDAKQKDFKEMLTHIYHDKSQIAAHKHEMESVIRFARQNGVPIIILYFPFPDETKSSETAYYQFVSQICYEQNVPLINAGELYADMSFEERTVNRWDHHPSVLQHQKVAKLIYLKLTALGYIIPSTAE